MLYWLGSVFWVLNALFGTLGVSASAAETAESRFTSTSDARPPCSIQADPCDGFSKSLLDRDQFFTAATSEAVRYRETPGIRAEGVRLIPRPRAELVRAAAWPRAPPALLAS